MTLGKRIRQARLEAGLSQRELCGEKITRNMLSLIENDAASPSMETLTYLSQRLDKSMGWFLDGKAVSPNAEILRRASAATPQAALVILKEYAPPDDVHDREYNHLLLLTTLTLSEEAFAAGKTGYCKELLQLCEDAAKASPYDTEDLKRRRIMLWFYLDESRAEELEAQLPGSADDYLLRASAALSRKAYSRCRSYLAAHNSEKAVFLRAESYFMEKDYENACAEYEKLPDSKAVFSRLEQCFRELGNYEKAYFYACKQRS